MTKIAAATLLALVSFSHRATDDSTSTERYYTRYNSMPIFLVGAIIVPCSKGLVEVSMKDGSVMFDSCTPDVSAAYWVKLVGDPANSVH